MRKPRILGTAEGNYYHVMSRVVDRRYVFGEEEKEFFRLAMRKLEAFTGVRVLTYCIMSNHWHALLEVPTLKGVVNDELCERIRSFYPKQRASAILEEFEWATKLAEETGSDLRLDELRQRYLSRMCNLSVFVKELKERFSKWYNRRNHRRGTLWEERFKSVLVENSDNAISTMAAYIDLNPVRAGLVDDPRDYRYCGYSEAVGGGARARQGIVCIMEMLGQDASWRKVSAQYRMLLFCAGEARENRTGMSPERVEKTLAEGGELDRFDLLRCRIRYFSDGVALGSRLFVEEVFETNRTLFSERRKDGARKMRGGNWNGLYSMRSLSHAVAAPT
ncbi:transposase [Pontiella desulfatans]|nr:transposase [Pontiella desulfatans]